MYKRELRLWVYQAQLCLPCPFLACSPGERQTQADKPYLTSHRCDTERGGEVDIAQLKAF